MSVTTSVSFDGEDVRVAFYQNGHCVATVYLDEDGDFYYTFPQTGAASDILNVKDTVT